MFLHLFLSRAPDPSVSLQAWTFYRMPDVVKSTLAGPWVVLVTAALLKLCSETQLLACILSFWCSLRRLRDACFAPFLKQRFLTTLPRFLWVTRASPSGWWPWQLLPPRVTARFFKSSTSQLLHEKQWGPEHVGVGGVHARSKREEGRWLGRGRAQRTRRIHVSVSAGVWRQATLWNQGRDRWQPLARAKLSKELMKDLKLDWSNLNISPGSSTGVECSILQIMRKTLKETKY